MSAPSGWVRRGVVAVGVAAAVMTVAGCGDDEAPPPSPPTFKPTLKPLPEPSLKMTAPEMTTGAP